MKKTIPHINLLVNEHIYLKHPESSELGVKILSGGIELINDLGFDAFTFRKLAQHICSTEASVYRYFESKHKLLQFLMAWYWAWMEYKLAFRLANVESAKDRLSRAIAVLTEEVKEDGDFAHINEVLLSRIVISESTKAYHHKDVDKENKNGIFIAYKQLVQRVSDVVLEIKPKYKYPHMLISTVIEGAHHQRFFAEHLPKLTDVVKGEDAITVFYTQMVFAAVERN